MGTGLLKNQSKAIRQFLSDKQNGEAWRKILFNAPAYAMERIAISMFYSVYKNDMSQEEKDAYRALREEIESSLTREDLEYLIKVMPQKQKAHYKSLLSLTPPEAQQPSAQKTEITQPQA